ncbi:MAG TPA: SRPBCC family protein [Daejeonella sp.]|nr:SRPBCC family protein [Daejeonella sp.]
MEKSTIPEALPATQTYLPVNINWPERIASIGAGVRLVSHGIKNMVAHPFRNTLLTATGGYLIYRGITGNCPIYNFIAKRITQKSASNIHINTTLMVNRPRWEVYNFWRELENLPLFMSHLVSIDKIDEKHSHWEAKLPGKVLQVGWDAAIVNDDPGNVIAWKSVAGSDINNSGKVEFSDSPDGHGTIIRTTISYMPPAGMVGNKVAKLLSPMFENMIRDDIRNFKRYIENRKNTLADSMPEADNFGSSAF